MKLYRSAYTMIELVMVILLVAIVSAVGYVSIASYRTQYLYAAAERMAADLRYTRNVAINSAQWHGAQFNINSGNPPNYYEIYRTDGITDTIVAFPQNMSKLFTVQISTEYPGITIIGLNSNKIEFSPLGVPYNDKNGTAFTTNRVITLSNGAKTVQVKIEAQTGRIFI